MKRVLSCLLIFLLVFSASLSFGAEYRPPSIVDNAEYLMQSELSTLSKMLDKLREQYDFEVAIYTETEMSGDTAEASADDIYDYSGYGAGGNDDGIMLYICSDTREYHFTTHGRGLSVFNSNGLAYMESKVVPYLAENDYYEAFAAYITTADELLAMAANGEPYNKKQRSTAFIIIVIAAALLVPFLVARGMTNSKLRKMKTAVENDYAANYMKPGSMQLTASRDLFLYSHITKTEKPKESGGSHTSSSGRTHGGGGGSF